MVKMALTDTPSIKLRFYGSKAGLVAKSSGHDDLSYRMLQITVSIDPSLLREFENEEGARRIIELNKAQEELELLEYCAKYDVVAYDM